MKLYKKLNRGIQETKSGRRGPHGKKNLCKDVDLTTQGSGRSREGPFSLK